jgi:hypothetical protein
MTRVERQHPLLVAGGGTDAASVYFIRPEIERRMGFPDNPLTVELNQELLMKLGRGEYTMVSLVARDYVMTLRNQTEAGPDWKVKELAKTFRFNFEPGGVYYLLIKPTDGEFRGVFFTAEEVDRFTARQNATLARPVAVSGDARLKEL